MERAPFSVEWLTQARIDRNWTQEHVATLMDVETKTVQRWEYGLHRPHIRQYQRLCQLFGKTQETLQEAASQPSIEHIAIIQPLDGRQTIQHAEPSEANDAYTRFHAHNITMRLLRLVLTWSPQKSPARYQALQTLLTQELEREDNNTMHENPITRRNALRYLASLPIELHGLSLLAPTLSKTYPYEELLAQCAAGITACWYLRKSKDLTFISAVISRYIPILKELVEHGPDAFRQDTAHLLAQCLLLKARCIIHTDRSYGASLHYAKQAETYATSGGHFELSIAAIRSQSDIFDFTNQWNRGMQAAQRGKALLDEYVKKGISISPFLQSALIIQLASSQAQMGKKYEQEALGHLKESRVAFYSESHTTVPNWLEHNEGSLFIMGGLIHYHLDMQKEAILSFKHLDSLQTSETTRTESFLSRVQAELERSDKPRDMEFCVQYWKQGLQKAIAIQSEQWFAEAKTVYHHMRTAWPHEQRIKILRDQIEHW